MTRQTSFRRALSLHRVAQLAAVALALVFVLFPIVWMVFASMRPTAETVAYPPVWWPRDVTFAAYAGIFGDQRELRYFANSYIISGSTALLCLALGVPCAYGFSRFKIRAAPVILLVLLALQMLPNVSVVLQFFEMARRFGIYNTHFALIVTHSAFVLPITIWLLKGFFDSIPIALEEAAMVDGATRLEAMWHVVLPPALPGLVSTAVFAFLWSWNEFLFAVVLTSGADAAPLTIRMSQFFSQFGRDWSGIMALNVLAAIPLVVAFIFVQRWVVAGLTAGAVK